MRTPCFATATAWGTPWLSSTMTCREVASAASQTALCPAALDPPGVVYWRVYTR